MERDEYMAKWHPDALVDFVERMGRFYGMDGQPIDRDGYVDLFLGDRTVARAHTVRGLVSTVLMGMDMGYGYGPPIIFETMVFGGPLDSSIGRYATLEEARRGHAEWVKLLAGNTRRPLIHNGKKSNRRKKFSRPR